MGKLAVTHGAARRDGRARSEGGRSWPRHLALWLASLPFLLFLVVPLLALVARARGARGALGERDGHGGGPGGSRLSAWTTSCTVGLTIAGGTPLAYLVARVPFRGRALVDSLLTLPIVMPPAVAGIALLLAFGRRGVIGQALDGWGIDVAFTPVAVILAQTFVAAPFYIQAAKVAFGGVDRDVEEAAAVDGATPLRVFRYVTVPLTMPALLGGVLLTWARALGEFGATIIFAGNLPGLTQTMPLAIYLDFEFDLQSALTLSLVLLGLSLVVLVAVRGILGQRVEGVR